MHQRNKIKISMSFVEDMETKYQGKLRNDVEGENDQR